MNSPAALCGVNFFALDNRLAGVLHLGHVLAGIFFIAPASSGDVSDVFGSYARRRRGLDSRRTPVVHVMARVKPGPCVVGDFVAFQARRRRALHSISSAMAISSSSLKFLQSSGAVLVVKGRAFFEGEIVGGQVRRLKFQRGVEVGI